MPVLFKNSVFDDSRNWEWFFYPTARTKLPKTLRPRRPASLECGDAKREREKADAPRSGTTASQNEIHAFIRLKLEVPNPS